MWKWLKCVFVTGHDRVCDKVVIAPPLSRIDIDGSGVLLDGLRGCTTIVYRCKRCGSITTVVALGKPE